MVLQHNSIQLEKRLGNGAFGEVFQAKFTAIGAIQPIEVAVKRVKGAAKREQLQEFCHEASIMAVLHHENIVAFYGIASLEEPIMVVMEMVTGGDLKKYLQNTSNISKAQIIYFALNIACGMRHLSSKNVIHRDLAARNCLITNELKVKISDFGLSIFGTDVIQKNLKKAPIRWLAPETLIKGMFNEKTDNPEARINFTTVKRRVQALYLQSLNTSLTSTTTNTNPATSPTVPLEFKKSEDRIRSFKINLSRKKSFDGAKSKTTSTRKRRFLSFRRKNKKLALPTGMTTTPSTNPSTEVTATTPSPTTPMTTTPMPAVSSTTTPETATPRSPSTNT
uniref:Protein kinase domain-containing protein n=1 Tax=Caenorhabditis tropicalis TaxID=1561998 RepID=A0A1I7U3K3_9PELO